MLGRLSWRFSTTLPGSQSAEWPRSCRMNEEPPEAAEALAMEIAIEPPPVVVVLEPTSSMPMQCHSGSPAQEPRRRCPRPWRSTERRPPC